MSLSERINIVNQKNKQREEELKSRLSLLAKLIKSRANEQLENNKLPKSKTEIKSKTKSESEIKQEIKSKTKSESEIKSKTEIFYESPVETSISMFDIKSNRNYEYILQYDHDINLSINVFVLMYCKVKGKLIELITDKSNVRFDPKITIPNATLIEKDGIIIIKFYYEYAEKYQNYKTSLVDFGFDYEITLFDQYYENLYSFENENGKFRVDLEIALK